MSLWGCNCPLPALAACHWRGMVCSWLSFFSPLFCAWAWQCLRLGLAFHVVVIPQSGLLAQVILLRLCLGHSDQILTLSNAARASLPSPRLLVAGAGVCPASLRGSYPWARNLSGLIIYLFFLPVMLPSVVPRLATDLWFQGSPQWECFLVFGNLSF